MKYAIKYNGLDMVRDRVMNELFPELQAHGQVKVELSDQLNYIINLTGFEDQQAVVRKEQDEFVVSLLVLHEEVEGLRCHCYNALIRTLSNLLICIIPENGTASEIHCITPEAGFYHYDYSPATLYQCMLPVISSRMMINNRISTDLPSEFSNTQKTKELVKYGGVLDSMGVLPSPFPLADVLSQENLEHLYRLFRIRGISYGNLSIREKLPGFNSNAFWMTARGVDKAHLKGVGKDLLLVTGYDLDERKILVSVPTDYFPRIRVSVDAIEHALIYENFQDVGAIVHVHAWMKDIPYTSLNYPCGTINLANGVVELLGKTQNPGRAVIGLKNHGITITGKDLYDIFSRIEGNLIREIPMMP